MTQISISPLYNHSGQFDPETRCHASSCIKEHSPLCNTPPKKPKMESILNLKLTNGDENVAFNQNFIYRRENDKEPSTITFPNDSRRENYPKEYEKASKSPERQNINLEELPRDHHRRKKKMTKLEPSTQNMMMVTHTPNTSREKQSGESVSPKTAKSGNYSHEFNELLIPMLKKFLLKLRNASYYRSPQQLKPEHYALLDDAAHFEESTEKESRLKICVRYFLDSSLTKHYLNFSTWDPYSPLRTCWDIMHLLTIMGMFFFVPLELAFLNLEFIFIRDWVYMLSLVFFIIDVFVNLNTGYYSDGALVTLRPKIFGYYIYKGLFMSDMSGIFALLIGNYFFIGTFAYYFTILMFGKFSRMKWLYNKLSNQFKLQTTFKGYMDLVNLLMTSLLVLHLISCFWLMLALMARDFYGREAQTWIKIHNLESQKWYIQYLYGFYWAVVTMMTVGYGDFIPQNSIETLYATFTIIFGCGVYGYYLNTVGILLQDIHKEENKFNSNLRVINMFMDRKSIDNELQMRVREYLRFIWNEEKAQNDEEEAKIINSLNTFLREELLLKAYGNILKQFPMFYANFSEKSLRKMVIFMKEVRYIPGDSIFFEDELDDSAIYFINKGSVEIFLSRVDKNIPISFRKMNAGECFGELSFFTGQPRESSARSLEFISVFTIKRTDFIAIIKENDDDYQKFCMIRDQIMLYNNCQSLRTRCSACGSLEHLIKDCGLLHYVPDIEKIVKKYEFYNDQPRFSNIRTRKKKPNGRRLFKRLQKTALRVQKELKRERENEKNEFLRRKFLNGEYDTIYFNSEMSLSSGEEEDNSFDEDGESSNESQVEPGDTNTFHTDTNRVQSRVGSSFENLMMKQSMESSNLDKQMFKRKVTKERSMDKIEKTEKNNEPNAIKTAKADDRFRFEKSEKNNEPNAIKSTKADDRIREPSKELSPLGASSLAKYSKMTRNEFQAKSEDNLPLNTLEIGVPAFLKRHSAVEDMLFREKPTASFKTREGSRPSLMVNANSNIIQRSSILEDLPNTNNGREMSKKKQFYPKKVSTQIERKLDTSSNLMVREGASKDREKSMGSKSSFHESRIMTRTKTRHKSKKLFNSITNGEYVHSGVNPHSKTSVNNPKEKDFSQTTMQQTDPLIFFEQVFSFKNYFPESNVGPVLDIYDKKRRKLMFLNEMKLLKPDNGGNIVLRKGTHIVPSNNSAYLAHEHQAQEESICKWSKYTFYPHKMRETSMRFPNKYGSPLKRRRREPPKIELPGRKKSVFGISRSKKSNFFGEVLVTNGAKKGFTDFVFDLLKDPKFQKWRKVKGKKPGIFFKRKK